MRSRFCLKRLARWTDEPEQRIRYEHSDNERWHHGTEDDEETRDKRSRTNTSWPEVTQPSRVFWVEKLVGSPGESQEGPPEHEPATEDEGDEGKVPGSLATTGSHECLVEGTEYGHAAV